MAAPEVAPGLFAWYAPGFSDPLGDRLLLFDNTEGRPLELLRLCAPIADAPDAEFLLRARAHELAGLEDERFAPVVRVDRLPHPGGGLALVSEHVEGQRLSDFLLLVAQRGGRVGADLTVSVLTKLVGALAALHARGPHVVHGAIAPERLVVSPGGRMVVTEYVLGSTLQHLELDRDDLWRRLRVALRPSPADPAFDQGTDVLQAALVAVAMLLGRPLHPDENATRSLSLLADAAVAARDAGFDEDRWNTLRDWLSRALCLSGRNGFPDAGEAARALEPLVGPAEEAMFAAARRMDRAPALPGSSSSFEAVRADLRRRRRQRRHRALAAAVAIAVGTAGVYLGARTLARSRVSPRASAVGAATARPKLVAPPAEATLDLRSDPAGARVFIDGEPRGSTPMLAADLAPGEHQVRLEIDGRSIAHTVTVEAARAATLFVPFRAAGATSAGWLAIASAVELQVYEKGRLLGTSRTDRIMLPAGRHDLTLVSEPVGFSLNREVVVPPGRTANLGIALPDGRADINAAPWAEVWIDGQKAGETPLAAYPLVPGRHTVTFRHPRLGERSVECFVTLREPLRLSADLRQ